MPDLRDQLDHFVEGRPDEGEPDEAANRLLRALRRLSRDEAEVKRIATEEVERIDAWASDRMAGISSEQERLRAELENFMRAQHERTQRKTVELPNGVLRLRAPQPSVGIEDVELFRDWAEANSRLDLLNIKVTADKAAIKKLLAIGPLVEGTEVEHIVVTPDGERVPGLVFGVPTQDGFSLDIAK